MVAASIPIIALSKGLSNDAIGLYIEPFQTQFGWSATVITLVFSLNRIESGVLSPVAGYLTDRLGGRVMVLTGMATIGLGLLLASQIHSLWQFYATFLIVSAGNSLGGVTIIWAVIVRWFDRYRGRALGVVNTATIGHWLVPMVAVVISRSGWRIALAGSGIVVLAICLPLALAIRSRPEDYGLLPDGSTLADPFPHAGEPLPPNQKQDASGGAEGLSVGQALRASSFWLIALATAVYGMGAHVSRLLLIPHLQTAGFSRELAGLSMAIVPLIGLPFRPLAGLMADKVDVKRAYPSLFLLQGLSFVILAYTTQMWQIFLFAIVYEPGWAAHLVFQNLLVSHFFGTRRFASIRGLMSPMITVIGMIGPVLGGAIFDVTGSYRLFFLILGGIALLGIPPIVLAKPVSWEQQAR
jgi:sugar phosphate permease